MLNSVENYVELGTNDGSPNLISSKDNTSGFLSGNVESSSTSNTHMVEKIDKMERLIIEGKVTLVDDESKPLKKVDYSGDHDSEDEVASTKNDVANFLASKKDGYGNNSLLEQWKESYMNGDYDFDPYDNDMYEAEGDLKKFSDIGAWYAIEDCAQYDKNCSNPTSAISDEIIANPNAQIVRDNMVRVQVPRCMAWLDYDEHVDSLSTIDNEVGVTSPESTTQTLLSFEEYTLLMTYPEEVEKTLGTTIEVEPLNETKLEEIGLNGNHNTPLSFREVPSFDGPEPKPLLNSPSLDVSLGDAIGPEPPIKPHSPDSSRMKNSNSYLRDILGDILGKDMYYPLTFVKPIRLSLVYKRNLKAQCYVRFD
ncbi:hypothetical protein Tco_0741610 [Tanacetum coccineum]